MGCGIIICSVCSREIHQTGPKMYEGRRGWTHCEDRTPMCIGGKPAYPHSKRDIVGLWCGCDEIPKLKRSGMAEEENS